MILASLRGLAALLQPSQNRFASICNGF